MSEDWKITQARQLQDYKKGASVFSGENNKSAESVGSLLNSMFPGQECLDVGCGILSLPEYMRTAPDVIFTGIDPFIGQEKQFKFVKGLAEKMPFTDHSFDVVLYATSLDHLLNPKRAMRETLRVLKDNGHLVIWGSFHRKGDKKYQLWLSTKSLKIYDHPWAFTVDSVSALAQGFKLLRIISMSMKEKIIIFQKNGRSE